MARTERPAQSNNGANIGFGAQLWAAADELRGVMDAAESLPPSATRCGRS